MSAPGKAVFFFCTDPAIDPVAGGVYQAAAAIWPLAETDIRVDDLPVRRYTDAAGSEFSFVQTRKVVSHDYLHYLPLLQSLFADCDLAGIITWHAGQNAPDAVLPVHTTGDVDTGYFSPANPIQMRNLLLSLDSHRREAGLDGFRVTTEATHWSGIVYQGGTPDLIPAYPVPMLDIEIGSTPDRWSDRTAAGVLARSLPAVFTGDGRKLKSLLCAGGVHFESAFATAAIQSWGEYAFGISHILANQWLVTGGYEGEDGPAKLEACVSSIQGGIDGIVIHDNLKGVYKDRFRVLGQKLGVPVFKHQFLRRPEDIPWRDR